MRWTVLPICVGALLAAACAGPPQPAEPAGAVPVVFVHGHGTSSAVFTEMIDHLESRGYPASSLLAVDLVPADGSNIAAAERTIAPAVEQLLARSGPASGGKVDIVAHSMGALSSRWYATQVRPDRVRTLVTIAGANHGTDAMCGSPDEGAAELCPAFAVADNSVQTRLNGTTAAPNDETPYGRGPDRPGTPTLAPESQLRIRYVAVLVPDDQWIRPNPSSELDGADAVPRLPAGAAVTQPRPGNLVFAGPTDHDLILEDEKFFAVLDAVLDAGAVP